MLAELTDRVKRGLFGGPLAPLPAAALALLGALLGEAWEVLLGVPRAQRASTLYGWRR